MNWAAYRSHDTPGGPPQARWRALGSSYYTTEHHPANRIYYARTFDQAAPWMSHLRARDQDALKRLNFSRYGVLAIFTVPHGPFGAYAVLLVKDGLSVQIRRGTELWVPVPRGRYALIRIPKDSLPSPVKRLYIGEPG